MLEPNQPPRKISIARLIMRTTVTGILLPEDKFQFLKTTLEKAIRPFRFQWLICTVRFYRENMTGRV
jgi:hypothetical protein